MLVRISIKALVLSALFWGCASRNALAANVTSTTAQIVTIPWMIILGVVIVGLIMIIYMGWLILGKIGRELQVANVHLLQSEMKEMNLTQRIHEATERYRKLEQELHQVQYELRKARGKA
ncbi:hypothetical protein ACE38W_17010 [Chitinophaga sp. Hz27]|uniref:hypothetical protein n=1 Tax=Chitinophaga sp. Hz27 TaxID=3347169 RepID=UPI0035E3677D